MILRNEYPRPQMVRDSFINLNGEWDFEFDDNNVGHKEKWFLNHKFSKKINVPFAFESKLSGICDTNYHDHIWYKKVFNIDENLEKKCVLANFLGVDYYSEIYINGFLVKTHYGASGSFSANLTPYLNKGENVIVVYCYDPGKDISIPRGKQDWEKESHGIWYTRTSGIYKPVFIEIINEKHVNRFFISTKLKDYEIEITLENSFNKGKVNFEINNQRDVLNFEFNIEKDNQTYNFKLPNDFVNDRIWRPEWPFLYDLKIKVYDENNNLVDDIKSYFGIREIKTKDTRVYLNEHEIYQKLLLNQGYYPDGILTAPSVKDMEKDILMMKEMGFNGCRIHQKVEEPYFLYLCDKLGFYVWQEIGACYGYNSFNPRRITNEWIDIIKDNYNHPSIIAYTPFNESWGIEGVPYSKKIQAHVMSLYYLIKSLDDTRLVISNDGWEHCITDLLTCHNYSHGNKDQTDLYKHFCETLKSRENILKYEGIGRFIINPGFKDCNEPILLTEFGGVAFKKDTDGKGKAWGYTVSNDSKEFINDLKRIYKAIEESSCIRGICYTQFSDVEQEVNGLLTYDRKYKVDPKIIKEINDTLK